MVSPDHSVTISAFSVAYLVLLYLGHHDVLQQRAQPSVPTERVPSGGRSRTSGRKDMLAGASGGWADQGEGCCGG